MNKNKVKLGNLVNNKTGVSQRKLVNFFGLTQQAISYVIRSKTTIKNFAREKAPDRKLNQINRAIKCSVHMTYDIFVGKDIVIDDEKYFSLSNKQNQVMIDFMQKDKSTTPGNVRYKQVDRYEIRY